MASQAVHSTWARGRWARVSRGSGVWGVGTCTWLCDDSVRVFAIGRFVQVWRLWRSLGSGFGGVGAHTTTPGVDRCPRLLARRARRRAARLCSCTVVSRVFAVRFSPRAPASGAILPGVCVRRALPPLGLACARGRWCNGADAAVLRVQKCGPVRLVGRLPVGMGVLSDTVALAGRGMSVMQRSCSARDEGRWCLPAGVCERAVVQWR